MLLSILISLQSVIFKNLHPRFCPKCTVVSIHEISIATIPFDRAEYFNGGSMDMITSVGALLHPKSWLSLSSLRDNEDAYSRYKLRPRILINVSKIDMSTTIFGTKVALSQYFSGFSVDRDPGFFPVGLRSSSHAQISTSRRGSSYFSRSCQEWHRHGPFGLVNQPYGRCHC